MDLEKRKTQLQSSLTLRKPMIKSTEIKKFQIENMGIQRKMMKFIRKLIGERWFKMKVWIYITEKIDRPGNTTGGSTKCDSLPGGN